MIKVESVPIGALAAFPQNARTHSDEQVEQIVRSVREFGWTNPLLIDEANILIAGHARLAAAGRLGMTEVPTIRLRHLSDMQKRALRLADNALAANAGWDLELLSAEVKAISDGLGPVEVIGFSNDYMDALMKGNTRALQAAQDHQARALMVEPEPRHGEDPDAPEDPGAEPDRAVELQAKWQTASGQLWEIPSSTMGGKSHRLLCGDSTRRQDVLRVMGGETAALCATDPPYLVDYTGERPNDSGKDWTHVYHEVDIQDATGFFRGVFSNVLEVLAPHAGIYCWHAHKRVTDIILVWRELGILDHQQIIWVKPTPVFGRVFWHFRHEPCLMGWRKGSIPPHDGDQSLDSVWEIDWEGKARIVGNDHPTQKPIEIFARPIRKHTLRGEVCYEPFSGSGSQLVAAEREGRRCYAIELEPAFVAVALERLAGMGLSPRRADDA